MPVTVVVAVPPMAALARLVPGRVVAGRPVVGAVGVAPVGASRGVHADVGDVVLEGGAAPKRVGTLC